MFDVSGRFFYDDEVQMLEVDPSYELMLLTALIVLSVLALWEGGRSLVHCCAARNTPRVRTVAKVRKGKSVEEKVQDAIKKELEGSGLLTRPLVF